MNDKKVFLFLTFVCGCTFFSPVFQHYLWKESRKIPSCRNDGKGTCQDWQGCPLPGQMLVTTFVKGRLGNMVWEYLSTWAVARRYNLWPVMPNSTITHLSKFFQNLSVPSIEEIAERCDGFDNLSEMAQNNFYFVGSHELLLATLEQRFDHQRRTVLLALPYYSVLTKELIPVWRELPLEMRLKQTLTNSAQGILRGIVNQIRGPNSTEEVELVSVHVRRTDYMRHMNVVYPGAEVADERFYLHAIMWMRHRMYPKRAAFVILTDDPEWCRFKLAAPDVFLTGNSKIESPGLDLALLGSCNHSIFAYGTFALTGAMLAQGNYTLVFDTQSSTYTKEMEFAPHLPGWHMLDHDGKELQTPYSFPFTIG